MPCVHVMNSIAFLSPWGYTAPPYVCFRCFLRSGFDGAQPAEFIAMEDVLSNIKNKTDDDSVILHVLAAVERDSAITQRSLAKELDVALGLAHTYLKRCVKKGYVKISQAPAKRYAYYLTPHGFSEKAKLTAEYLNQSFRFFRYAKKQLETLLDRCIDRGWTRVALAGGSDLAEIAMLAASLRNITLIGLIDPDQKADFGLPLLALEELSRLEVQAVIVTSLNHAEATYEKLMDVMPGERILVPPLLRIRTLPITVE